MGGTSEEAINGSHWYVQSTIDTWGQLELSYCIHITNIY